MSYYTPNDRGGRGGHNQFSTPAGSGRGRGGQPFNASGSYGGGSGNSYGQNMNSTPQYDNFSHLSPQYDNSFNNSYHGGSRNSYGQGSNQGRRGGYNGHSGRGTQGPKQRQTPSIAYLLEVPGYPLHNNDSNPQVRVIVLLEVSTTTTENHIEMVVPGHSMTCKTNTQALVCDLVDPETVPMCNQAYAFLPSGHQLASGKPLTSHHPDRILSVDGLQFVRVGVIEQAMRVITAPQLIVQLDDGLSPKDFPQGMRLGWDTANYSRPINKIYNQEAEKFPYEKKLDPNYTGRQRKAKKRAKEMDIKTGNWKPFKVDKTKLTDNQLRNAKPYNNRGARGNGRGGGRGRGGGSSGGRGGFSGGRGDYSGGSGGNSGGRGGYHRGRGGFSSGRGQ
ncbi:MAG: hypothetical protein M1831_006470 [Alyxoria varia]|nr:MAG: hypothetical protein M1831_006470 [Alyxoria varia]